MAEAGAPVEVLRLEGNLYLYAPSAESFVASGQAQEGLKLLIAARSVLGRHGAPPRPVRRMWRRATWRRAAIGAIGYRALSFKWL